MKHLAILTVPAAILAMMASSVRGETALAIRPPQLGSVFKEQSRQTWGLRYQPGPWWSKPGSHRWQNGRQFDCGATSGQWPVDWRDNQKVLRSELFLLGADAVALSPSAFTVMVPLVQFSPVTVDLLPFVRHSKLHYTAVSCCAARALNCPDVARTARSEFGSLMKCRTIQFRK